MDREKRLPLIILGAILACLVAFILANAFLFSGSGEEESVSDGGGGGEGNSAPEIGSSGDSQPVSSGRPDPPVTLMRVLYNYDITDPEALVERSEEVVVAEVEQQTGDQPMESSIPGDSEPRGQYEVRVLEGIKGSASEGDTLRIEQRGGTDEDGDPVVVEAQSGAGEISEEQARDELLQEGETYLFALGEEGAAAAPYLVLAQPTGNILLADNPESERVLEAFREAAN